MSAGGPTGGRLVLRPGHSRVARRPSRHKGACSKRPYAPTLAEAPMTQRLVAPAAPVAVPVAPPAPAFTFKATGTHVQVRGTSRALGLKELMATMKTEPRLHNC